MWFRECVGSLGGILQAFPEGCQIPLREWTNAGVKFALNRFGTVFDAVSDQITLVLRYVELSLLWVPWWLIVAVIGLVSWHASRHRLMTLGLVASLFVIGMMGLWDDTMRTLALMLVATSITVVSGIPVGILMATNRWVRAVVSPILDAMQTLPPFVYLIPVVFFLGLGNVSAIFAICVYAVPPMVRLTNLGIRLVDRSTIEAADAFGATRRQILWGVRMPLAMPAIMTGVNQSIMMALAMAVIASMIGARGLGANVLRGVNNGDVGFGLESGLAVLALAVILDRVTAAYGARLDPTQTLKT
ncbi:MAG: proline/glycine betaine ABC transporter permease [Spirochaetaceae bacterium]|nr:proline/glycine betaine ABC transporter permease [Spirochaetaceae bacterium]